MCSSKWAVKELLRRERGVHLSDYVVVVQWPYVLSRTIREIVMMTAIP